MLWSGSNVKPNTVTIGWHLYASSWYLGIERVCEWSCMNVWVVVVLLPSFYLIVCGSLSVCKSWSMSVLRLGIGWQCNWAETILLFPSYQYKVSTCHCGTYTLLDYELLKVLLYFLVAFHWFSSLGCCSWFIYVKGLKMGTMIVRIHGGNILWR